MASNEEMNSTNEPRHELPIEGEAADKDEHLDDEEKDDPNEPRGSVSGRKDSTTKSVKLGHLRVGEDGQTMYKRTPTSAIMAAIQLGIGYSVGRLAAKPERDVLMVDFSFVEKVWFPGTGSRETPSHKFSDFRFKSYAPVAFRYFRDLFGIQPSDFLMSLSHEEVREVGNPGASGSLFFLSKDDMFIVKTVQHKEAVFLQQLLPGYYMNLHQNPRTLLPKFFGLYCYQSGSTNIRLIVMNNLLPSRFKYHMKYDLKGSTFKRRASKAELAKKSPTLKDLDFLNNHPEGILLEAETYDAVMKTIMRDCRVLESFKIMDYSLLLGIHNLDQAAKDKALSSPYPSAEFLNDNPERVARRDEFSAALEAIQIDREGDRPVGGVPAKNAKGERLILFIGVIDILQSYRLQKKLEHGWKSLLHDGDTVSVHKPSFYAKRFLEFMGNKVFKRMPTVTRGPSKRRANFRQGGTPYRGKSSTIDSPMARLGDDMVPPPYELPSSDPSSVPVEATSAASSTEKTQVEVSTAVKTVKFNVDTEANEGTEPNQSDTGGGSQVEGTTEDNSVMRQISSEKTETNTIVLEAQPVAVDERNNSVESAPPTTGDSATAVVTLSSGRNESSTVVESIVETVTTANTVHVSKGTETLQGDGDASQETTRTGEAEVVISKGGATSDGYQVTIVKEVHTIDSDGKDYVTTSSTTESGPGVIGNIKESASSEFVIIDRAAPVRTLDGEPVPVVTLTPGEHQEVSSVTMAGVSDAASSDSDPSSTTSKL